MRADRESPGRGAPDGPPTILTPPRPPLSRGRIARLVGTVRNAAVGGVALVECGAVLVLFLAIAPPPPLGPATAAVAATLRLVAAALAVGFAVGFGLAVVGVGAGATAACAGPRATAMAGAVDCATPFPTLPRRATLFPTVTRDLPAETLAAFAGLPDFLGALISFLLGLWPFRPLPLDPQPNPTSPSSAFPSSHAYREFTRAHSSRVNEIYQQKADRQSILTITERNWCGVCAGLHQD
jgi:hypothetical protein